MQEISSFTVIELALEMWSLTKQISTQISEISGLEDFGNGFKKQFEPLIQNCLDQPILHNLFLYTQAWKILSPEITERLSNI